MEREDIIRKEGVRGRDDDIWVCTVWMMTSSVCVHYLCARDKGKNVPDSKWHTTDRFLGKNINFPATSVHIS